MSEAWAPPRYQVLPMPLTDQFKAKHGRAWTERAKLGVGNPLRGALLMIVVAAFFGFGVSMLVPPVWRGLIVGLFTLAGIAVAWTAYSNGKRIQADLAQRLQALQSACDAQLHIVDLNGPHRFVRHEHGVILLVPAGPQQIFFYPVSNCTDDPIEEEVYAALEAKQMPSRWSWSEIPGVPGQHSFEMIGAPIVPLMHPEFASVDEWGDFVDSLGEEFHGSGHILSRDFDSILEPAQ